MIFPQQIPRQPLLSSLKLLRRHDMSTKASQHVFSSIGQGAPENWQITCIALLLRASTCAGTFSLLRTTCRRPRVRRPAYNARPVLFVHYRWTYWTSMIQLAVQSSSKSQQRFHSKACMHGCFCMTFVTQDQVILTTGIRPLQVAMSSVVSLKIQDRRQRV